MLKIYLRRAASSIADVNARVISTSLTFISEAPCLGSNILEVITLIRTTTILALATVTGACGSDPREKCEDTIDAKINAYVFAQTYVKTQLKSPSTAEFPDFADAEIRHMAPCNFLVTGFVDSQNEFGAVTRTQYETHLEWLPGESSMQPHSFRSLP